MARQKPYNLYKRKIKKANGNTSVVYYYSINPPSGVPTILCKEEQRKSTGCSTIAETEAFVLRRIEQLKASGSVRLSAITFGEYAEPYYDWERCPHVHRYKSEGKTITENSVTKQRSVMKLHVLSDVDLCGIPLSELRKSDLIDYRTRLVSKKGLCRTSQKAFDILKTILKEAYFREDIDRDVTVSLGKIQYDATESGTFTEEEIQELFRECPGHFKDQYDYTAFLLAFSTGMRHGEIMALYWKDIDFEKGHLLVDHAWKGKELGLPKWEKIRSTVIPKPALDALAQLRKKVVNRADDDFIFSYLDGNVFGETWWSKRFTKAMESAEIDKEGRNLKPHSFRHTLNTMLLAKGQSAEKVRASMGWSSPVVQEGYTHWKPEHFEDQRETVDDLFRGIVEL